MAEWIRPEQTRNDVGDRGPSRPFWLTTIPLCFPVWYLALGFALDGGQHELPYSVTEYMVTFAGGFVRRGLLGSMFWKLAGLFGCPALQVIALFRVAVAVAFMVTVCWALRKRLPVLGASGVALVASSPAIGLYLWFSPGAVDVLFILFTAFHLWLAMRFRSGYFGPALCLFWTAGVFLSLGHEAILFLGFPVNVGISLSFLGPRPWWRMAAIYFPPLAACMVAVLFHGTRIQAAAIETAWKLHGVVLPQSNAIRPLAATLPEEVRYVWQLLTPVHLAVWVSSTAACIAPLAYLVRKGSGPTGELRARLIRYFWIPVVCTLPLYVIGTDWHRWVALPLCTGILCMLIDFPTQLVWQWPKRSRGTVLALSLVGLVVVPTGLYFPVRNALGGPLTLTIHALRTQKLGAG